VTATSFATAVEDPENFRRSRSVGAWLGLSQYRNFRVWVGRLILSRPWLG